jgi:hypothetical protein
MKMKELFTLLTRLVVALESMVASFNVRNEMQKEYIEERAPKVTAGEVKKPVDPPKSEQVVTDNTTVVGNIDSRLDDGGFAEVKKSPTRTTKKEMDELRARATGLGIGYGAKSDAKKLRKLIEEVEANVVSAESVIASPGHSTEPMDDLFDDDVESTRPVVDREMVRAVAIAFSGTQGRDETLAILDKYGASTLSEIDVKDYAAVHEDFTK